MKRGTPKFKGTVRSCWYNLDTSQYNETSEQSKQWIFRDECAPKKAKTNLSANKVDYVKLQND